MNITNAESLALIAMSEHGLISEGWTFSFDRAKRRFGVCKHRTKQISLSRELTLLNDESQVTDTILHEIAHALCGPRNGHNGVWRMKCREIGANPTRCYSSDEVIQPKAKWIGICPNEHKTKAMKRMKVACSKCCNEFNRGKFSSDFMFVWTPNEELVLNS